MIRVVIVGGGFGGLGVLRALKNKKDIQITMVTDRRNFRYSPSLYRSATGFTMRASVLPISSMVVDCQNVTVVYGKATRIDAQKRHIMVGSEVIAYDIAVFGLGAVPNDFGIPGVAEHTYSIASSQEIFKLRKHLHEYIAKNQETDQHYVIVGAGPTGVETAAGMASYIRLITKKHRIKRSRTDVQLLDVADRPLSSLSRASSRRVAQRLKKLKVHFRPYAKVERVAKGKLTTDKREYATTTVLWTAGAKTNPFYEKNTNVFSKSSRGLVEVDEFLQVDERIFVIGDNAHTTYSGYAQTAIHNARYVARQIIRISRKKTMKAYRPSRPFSIVPVGRSWAVFEYNTIRFGGKMPALLRAAADLIGYLDVMPAKLALKVWRGRNADEEYCSICKNR